MPVPYAAAPSLHKRLLLAASIALVAFLGVTGLILDIAFRDSARAALRDRLQTQVYALLAAAELRPATGELHIPDSLPEERLSRPVSGLYAAVFGKDFVWRSESVLGIELDWRRDLQPGVVVFEGPSMTNQGPVFRLAQGVGWETASGGVRNFTFNVIEDLTAYNAQVSQFRQTLWFWLGAAALLLLILQYFLLRWSLRPLRRISRELSAVESGKQDQLEGDYPVELEAFKNHLNGFLDAERERLARYRNTLADLAHSLKTPLAVIRSGLESKASRDSGRQRLLQQLKRMDDIVAWRLKKAARAGGRTLGVSTPIKPVAVQLARALEKVHHDRHIHFVCDIAQDARFPGEEGDLYELLGNLMDNAFKFAKSEVHVSARKASTGRGSTISLTVEDDGAGINETELPELLRRGQRGDECVPGHGLGLSMVDDIVRSYGGVLYTERSTLGGARIVATFPGNV